MSNWRVTGKYAGQMRSQEVNSIGGAAARASTPRIPGFNDYASRYPWIGTISVTNNFTLTNDDVPRGDLRLGAEPARLDDHHAGLEPLQCRARRSAAAVSTTRA